MRESPAVILYDHWGHPIGVVLEGTVYKLQAQITGAAPANSPPIGNPVFIAGTDGTNVIPLKTNIDGYLKVDAAINLGSLTIPINSEGVNNTTIPNYSSLSGGKDNNNLLKPISINSNGNIRITNNNDLTYCATTSTNIASNTVAGTIKSLAYLFHSSSNSLDADIIKIMISYSGGAGGEITVGGNFISLENSPAGGASETITALDGYDAPSSLIFRSSANTPIRSNQIFNFNIIPDQNLNNLTIFESNLNIKSIKLRNRINEGFEIYSKVNSTVINPINIRITFFWKEYNP